jgi:hypothetical protein
MAKIGHALSRTEVIELANELIVGTEHAVAITKFKEQRGMKITGNKYVSKSWYQGFMRRNADKLKRGRCRVIDTNRHTWCTYENFERMYEGVYAAMVEAGIAVRSEEKVMYDEKGEITEDVSKMVGRPTNVILTHPEYLLFVDETGCNTNQKEDKYVGGEQFMLPRMEAAGGVIGASTDIHFTILCFTNALGDPVMCSVILKSEKHISDLPISWKFGIDITKNFGKGKLKHQFFRANCGDNHAFTGGPKCTYQDKVIPCFVGCSPKASITSEMLTSMLQTIDSLHVYDRSTGQCPCLLLDGHHSRMKLPFLKYINDPAHLWQVCLGVPYGTHIWQVADALELNGCFKMALTKAKRYYLTFRDEKNSFPQILSHW